MQCPCGADAAGPSGGAGTGADVAHPAPPSAQAQTRPWPGAAEPAAAAGSGKGFSHPAGTPGASVLPPSCLWPPSATWSGLGKLRHSQATALEKRCEPPPPPSHCPPFIPSPRVWESWGAGDPLFRGRRLLPPPDPPPAQMEKKGKLGEVPSETSWAGSEGPLCPPPHRTPTTFDPFEGDTLPRLAHRTLYLW